VLAALLRGGINHPDQARELLTSTEPQTSQGCSGVVIHP